MLRVLSCCRASREGYSYSCPTSGARTRRTRQKKHGLALLPSTRIRRGSFARLPLRIRCLWHSESWLPARTHTSWTIGPQVPSQDSGSRGEVAEQLVIAPALPRRIRKPKLRDTGPLRICTIAISSHVPSFIAFMFASRSRCGGLELCIKPPLSRSGGKFEAHLACYGVHTVPM